MRSEDLHFVLMNGSVNAEYANGYYYPKHRKEQKMVRMYQLNFVNSSYTRVKLGNFR
jgi:hypothetical protein